jgi:subfamily B ATP-binding cassette protein MsbA
MNNLKLYKRLLRESTKHKKKLIIALVFISISGAMEPLFPALLKPLMDNGFGDKDIAYVMYIAVAIPIIFFMRGLLTYAGNYLSSWVAANIVHKLRVEMFTSLSKSEYGYLSGLPPVKIASQLVNDVIGLTTAATSALNTLVKDTITVLALLGWLAWIDFQLTLLILFSGPLISASVKYFGKRLRKLNKKNQLELAELAQSAADSLANAKIIKVIGAEKTESENFSKLAEKQKNTNIKLNASAKALSPIVQLIVSIITGTILVLAFFHDSSVTASPGSFLSYLTALLMLIPPIKRLTEINSSIQRGLAAAETVFDIIDLPTDLISSAPKASTDTQTTLNIKSLHFRYANTPNKKTLNNINLKAIKNQITVIAGESGSGKSTLLDIISGLRRFSDGRISFRGIDYQPESITAIRELISLVPQQPYLLNRSIFENICIGDRNPNQEACLQALTDANALEFVLKLHNGIFTSIGKGGYQLSGGQAQRIALARALYQDKPILILDEATSALDTINENEINNTLNKIKKDKVIIVVAHRPTTIKTADYVYILKNGEVICGGKPSDLEKTCKNYALLAQPED